MKCKYLMLWEWEIMSRIEQTITVDTHESTGTLCGLVDITLYFLMQLPGFSHQYLQNIIKYKIVHHKRVLIEITQVKMSGWSIMMLVIITSPFPLPTWSGLRQVLGCLTKIYMLESVVAEKVAGARKKWESPRRRVPCQLLPLNKLHYDLLLGVLPGPLPPSQLI